MKELCTKFSGDVYLTSRNESLGKAAVAHLENLGLHPKYHQLDIDDESSVLKLRDYLKSNYGGLDVLVNNAAIQFWLDSPLSFHEKAVQTLQTNFFSTKRACDILFPILKPHARVVNVSSTAGNLFKITNQELRSKFASPNLTYEELDSLMEDYIEYNSDTLWHYSYKDKILFNLYYLLCNRSAKNVDYAEKGWPNIPMTKYGSELVDVMKN